MQNLNRELTNKLLKIKNSVDEIFILRVQRDFRNVWHIFDSISGRKRFYIRLSWLKKTRNPFSISKNFYCITFSTLSIFRRVFIVSIPAACFVYGFRSTLLSACTGMFEPNNRVPRDAERPRESCMFTVFVLPHQPQLFISFSRVTCFSYCYFYITFTYVYNLSCLRPRLLFAHRRRLSIYVRCGLEKIQKKKKNRGKNCHPPHGDVLHGVFTHVYIYVYNTFRTNSGGERGGGDRGGGGGSNNNL